MKSMFFLQGMKNPSKHRKLYYLPKSKRGKNEWRTNKDVYE